VSVSRGLIEDVRHLLLRFGVVGRVDSYETGFLPAWRVSLQSGGPVGMFADRIGFVAKQIGDVGPSASIVERVSPQWRELLNHSVPLRKLGIRVDNKYATRLAKVERVAVAEQNDALFDLVEADVWWDEVASVEPTEDEESYDIQVEGVESYVADGVVSHNTTLFIHRAARRIGQTEGRRRLGILTAVDDDANARSGAIKAIVQSERFAEVFPQRQAARADDRPSHRSRRAPARTRRRRRPMR
jgi:hypothetical protein